MKSGGSGSVGVGERGTESSWSSVSGKLWALVPVFLVLLR